MRRCAAIAALLLVAGCEKEPSVAYIQQFDRVQEVLDDETPSRSWNLHVQTNPQAMRSGLTWTTVDVEAVASIEPVDPWQEQYLDATLTGDEPFEDTLRWSQPGQLTANLVERYQVDCVEGESCEWDYVLVMTRREGGVSEIALDIQTRALVTLGTVDEAPDGAEMSFEATELE